MNDRSDFIVENHSKLEPWIVEHVCRPILHHLPRRIHPNTISIANHVVCWSVFAVLAIAPQLDAGPALLARIWGGLGLLLSLVLDCLDGMQARRIGKCSKLGEVMDHWLDAINVPLCSAGFLLTLQPDPFTMAVALMLTGMIYNSQLILYHHTGRFIHGDTSGADAQVMLAVAITSMGLFLFFFPRELAWAGLVILVFVWGANLVQAKVIWFFVRRLKGYLRYHTAFISLVAAAGLLHAIGVISALACALVIAFLSFRINGSYVLYTVTRKDYGGLDWLAVLLVVAIAPIEYLLGDVYISGYQLQGAAAALVCLYVVTANLYDLARQMPLLRKADAAVRHPGAA